MHLDKTDFLDLLRRLIEEEFSRAVQMRLAAKNTTTIFLSITFIIVNGFILFHDRQLQSCVFDLESNQKSWFELLVKVYFSFSENGFGFGFVLIQKDVLDANFRVARWFNVKSFFFLQKIRRLISELPDESI